MLSPIGVMLRQAGIRVLVPDLPGYGLSLISADHFRYEAWVDLAADLTDMTVDDTGGPVVLFGLSLGGFLAYCAAARSKKASGVIATTLADPREQKVRDEFAANLLASRIGLPILVHLGAPLDRIKVPIRWLSKMDKIANIPELTALIEKDPLGGGNHTPLGFLKSLFLLRPDIEPEDFTLCPILFAQPDADRWTTLESSLPFFNRLACEKELVLLKNRGHFPLEEPGATQLEEAVEAFLRRLEQTTDRPAAGGQ